MRETPRPALRYPPSFLIAHELNDGVGLELHPHRNQGARDEKIKKEVIGVRRVEFATGRYRVDKIVNRGIYSQGNYCEKNCCRDI